MFFFVYMSNNYGLLLGFCEWDVIETGFYSILLESIDVVLFVYRALNLSGLQLQNSFPRVDQQLQSLFSCLVLALLLGACSMHAYFRAHSEMLAEFPCRIWCSPSEVLSFLGHPPHFLTTVVSQSQEDRGSVWAPAVLFLMGTGPAGHETHLVQISFSKSRPPSSFCLLLVVFSLLFFKLCPDVMEVWSDYSAFIESRTTWFLKFQCSGRYGHVF